TLQNNVIEAEHVTGPFKGKRVFLLCVELLPTNSSLPFGFKRQQFPCQLAFAMPIHKSQEQTMNCVGLYILKPVFSHGQLYVACSHVTTYQKLRIFLGPVNQELQFCTKNIVYPEIFQRCGHTIMG
ncbi:40963_t:CDS:1, partial [Gigaspora margarita]